MPVVVVSKQTVVDGGGGGRKRDGEQGEWEKCLQQMAVKAMNWNGRRSSQVSMTVLI